MRPSPLNPIGRDDWGYETPQAKPDNPSRRTLPRSAQGSRSGNGHDHSAPNGFTPGVITDSRYSFASIGNRSKAEKMPGLDPHPKLTSFYMLSGLSKVRPTLPAFC